MRSKVFAVIIGILFSTAAVRAEVYDLNGQRVDVTINGAEMYMRSSTGALRFEGGINKRDGSITGTMTLQFGRCGHHSYGVVGLLSGDGEKINFAGEAPRFNNRCEKVGTIRRGPTAIFDLNRFHY